MKDLYSSFLLAIRTQFNADGSLYLYADLDGFRYGQCYREPKQAQERFISFYFPHYQRDYASNFI